MGKCEYVLIDNSRIGKADLGKSQRVVLPPQQPTGVRSEGTAGALV